MTIKFPRFFLFLFLLLLLPISTLSGEGSPPANSTDSSTNEIPLTEEEKIWLEQNPVVRARVGNNPPLHFYDGENRGVSVDYFNLIAEKVGFKVEYIHGIPWAEALEKIKNQETIDLILTAKNSEDRRPYMRFTDDYLMMPWVVFSRTGSDFISAIDDLSGKTVAVEKRFVMQKLLMTEYPAINLLEKPHSKEALQAVASGEADAYIGNLATSTYLINKYHLTNLKVACPTPFDNHNQAFVVRNDWPELVSILNKAITSIPQHQLTEFRNKWFNLNIEYGITKSKFFKWIGSISGLSLIFILFFSWWVITLRKQIARRHKAEKERNELERRLRQAQKMEAIGTLAGGIAHDFNNLLGVIIGYTDLAKEDAPAGGQFDDDLEEVSNAANRARDLVKQILDFSRQVEVERHPLKLQPLLKEGLGMLRSSIPATIHIDEDIAPNCGAVLADPIQVHQIILNLCTNAYQAMETEGGTLSVVLRTTSITQDDNRLLVHLTPGEYVRLTVSDSGVGIGPDVIDKIFDPFFSTKEVGKGTGMGLSIIHGIMKECGGTITVDSQLGKGTQFDVYFPVVSEDAVSASEETEDTPKGSERVLLIDDEAILADMSKDMLERLGYRVTVQYSGVEALETFQDRPDEFDLVITDQTMPGMTGADLSARIRKIRPMIPIILCTGYSNLVDEDSVKELGINELAYKPLNRKTIAILIRKVMDVE